MSSDTLFGLLHQILTVVSTLATAQQVEAISTKIDGFDSQLRDISATMKNTQAVMGGGCYYTIYTMRPYLLGYKLTLTDGTMAKSCYVQRDEDSGKYTGVLSVSLGGTITIKVIDPTTQVEQCRVTTPASSNSYATINLDELLNPKYADVLNVNDTLATALYKDSFFTNSSTYTPTVCNYLAQHQEHLQDFLQSCAGISVSSQNFDALYDNVAEFISVVGSSAGAFLLANSTFGNTVANNLSLLQAMSHDSSITSKCNDIPQFRNYLSNTSLAKSTSTKAGGVLNSVSGNLICIDITSGARGHCDPCYEQWRWSSPQTWDDESRYYTYNTEHIVAIGNSFRGTAAVSKNNVSKQICSSDEQQVTKVRNDYVKVDSYNGTSQVLNTFYYGGDTAQANRWYTVGMFADNITVSAYSGYSPAANSVITYIDLDAAD